MLAPFDEAARYIPKFARAPKELARKRASKPHARSPHIAYSYTAVLVMYEAALTI
jgi:hypothetical protein